MRYCEHGCVSDVIRIPNLMNITQKWIIICGVAEGMRIIHSKRIAHRDIQPENVLVDSEYRPLICDFEFARPWETGETRFTTVLGSSGYIAPEGVKNDEAIPAGPPSDVFSFAMFAYYVLTGRTPQEAVGATTDESFNSAIAGDTRPELRDLPRDLTDLIQRSWSSEPGERPTFADISEKVWLPSVFPAGVDETILARYRDYVSYRTLTLTVDGAQIEKKFGLEQTVSDIQRALVSDFGAKARRASLFRAGDGFSLRFRDSRHFSAGALQRHFRLLLGHRPRLQREGGGSLARGRDFEAIYGFPTEVAGFEGTTIEIQGKRTCSGWRSSAVARLIDGCLTIRDLRLKWKQEDCDFRQSPFRI
jgi:hypothetical protein